MLAGCEVDIPFEFPRHGQAVIDGLSLDIKAGEKVVIIDPNVIGKATVLRCHTGFNSGFRCDQMGGKTRLGYLCGRFAEELSLTEGWINADLNWRDEV